MEAVILGILQYVGPLLAGIGAIFGLALVHKRGKQRAANEAREDERKRITKKAEQAAVEVSEKANEKRRQIDDLERDDLRRRMREAAGKGSRRMRVDPADRVDR